VMVRLSVRNRCPGESCSQVKPRPSVCMQISPNHFPWSVNLAVWMSEATAGLPFPRFASLMAG
jgi:hypothetical protein